MSKRKYNKTIYSVFPVFFFTYMSVFLYVKLLCKSVEKTIEINLNWID